MDDHLPGDKQFLITERVPCQRRVADVENEANTIKEVELDDGWYEARPADGAGGQDEEIDDIDNVI